jgi:hypothetical protein
MKRRLSLVATLLAVTAVAAFVAASVWTSPAAASLTQVFTTPGAATFTVPDGATSVTVEAWGAQGGAGGGFGSPCTPAAAGGFGGDVKATYAVSPGDTLYLYVGAKGGDGGCGGDGGTGGTGGAGGASDANGGSGGSGAGDAGVNIGGGGGGGGETDVRVGGTDLADRIISAGGGGGTGGLGGAGGAGGGLTGDPGTTVSSAAGGAGGTRIIDGGGGTSTDGAAGGSASDSGSGGGGGGGGGLCGGGGGDPGTSGGAGAGGGGGSGFVDDASSCGGAANPDATLVSQRNGIDAGNNGNGKIVITYTVPPHTRPAADVAATSATLRGYDSNNDMYSFEYGTDTTYGKTTPLAPATEPSPPTSLDQPVTGLTPATTYHYRIVSADGGPGDDIDFTTLALPRTGSATDVTATTATLQGADANSGESYHFEYGLTTAYGTSTPTATSNGGTLTAALASLHAGSTYHFRIVSAAGAGSDVTFSTLHFPATLPAVLVTSDSAKLEGIDTNSGTSYHFDWGTTTAYGNSTASHAAPGDTSTLSAVLSGLKPATTYHYRIVDSVTGAARDVSFKTKSSGSVAAKHDLVLGLHGPASGSVGKSLRYVATIGNRGTAAVTGAKLKLSFRGGSVKIVSARGCKGTTSLTCALPKIAAGHAVRVKIVLRETKAAVLSLKGSLVTPFTDPTPKNNRASTRTTVK